MSKFRRYGIYYVPDDPEFSRFGATWLGWDLVCGEVCAQLPVSGLRDATEAPRKYGFHATLKPPFRLAEECSVDGLAKDIATLAARTAPVALEGLRLASLGRFLAFVPVGDLAGIDRLAFACVRAVDTYRRPADAVELERRRSGRLSARQEEMLQAWGYPYVGAEFRFHLTLTGNLDRQDLPRFRAAAELHMPPLPRPFVVNSIALAGEDAAGMFHLIERYTLRG